jgi:hypothetical protein
MWRVGPFSKQGSGATVGGNEVRHLDLRIRLGSFGAFGFPWPSEEASAQR